MNPIETDIIEESKKLTNGLGPEVVLEMSGSPKALADSFKAVAQGKMWNRERALAADVP